jgi:hypothetical protein
LKLIQFASQSLRSYAEWKAEFVQPEPSLFDDDVQTSAQVPPAQGSLDPGLMDQGPSEAEAVSAAFAEHNAYILADEIKQFIASPKTPGEYRDFVSYIFREALEVPPELPSKQVSPKQVSTQPSPADPVWDFLAHIEQETDFYTAPASTRYHGAEAGGLVRHSLLVTAYGIKLAPILLAGEVNMYHLVIACLFHDLCKVNMYETKTRNVKNEATGKWETAPFYAVKPDYLAFGHGIESLLRLNEYITMPPAWNHAIRWHMGAYDISEGDRPSLKKAQEKYKEVLFLQAADMQAGLGDVI